MSVFDPTLQAVADDLACADLLESELEARGIRLGLERVIISSRATQPRFQVILYGGRKVLTGFRGRVQRDGWALQNFPMSYALEPMIELVEKQLRR